MDQMHNGPIIGATHVNPADVLNSGYGVQVNTSGDRFMDENNTYVIKARTCARETLDNFAWVIVDSTCPVLDKVIPKFDHLNSPYGKADTIEALCKSVKLPVEKVTKLVADYNARVEKNTLGEMNPPCTYKKPHPIAKAPSTRSPSRAVSRPPSAVRSSTRRRKFNRWTAVRSRASTRSGTTWAACTATRTTC